MGAHARAAAQPERVLAYSKRVDVRWGSVGARLRGVVALSDVMRFDLTPLRRRMQPAIEAHARLNRGEGLNRHGQHQHQPPCEAVACARVYHINVVLRVRAAAPTPGGSTGKNEKNEKNEKSKKEKSDTLLPAAAGTMVLERARVVMDQNGIVRLEPAGRSRLAVKPARAVAGVAAGLAAWGGGGGGGVGGSVDAKRGAAAAAAAPAVVIKGPRGSRGPAALSTEHHQAPGAKDDDSSSKGVVGGDFSSGRFRGFWRNSAAKLAAVSRKKGPKEGQEESVIVAGDRDRSEGEEAEEEEDDEPTGLFPIGDEAV